MRPNFFLVVVVAGCVASACDDAGSREPTSSTVDDANVTTFGIAEPSARQLEMVSDGEVNFQEYEEVYLTYIQCVVDEGIELREKPRLDAHGKYYEASFWLGAETEVEANRLIMQTCQDQHLLSVLRLWDTANRPSGSLLQQANQAVVDCLDRRSIKKPSHLSIDEFAVLLEAAASGEVRLIPTHLSLEDIEVVLAEGRDASDLFASFLACRREVAQQFPVGW